MISFRPSSLDRIENNHEAFVRDGTIVCSPGIDALMQGPA
jgi:hypothetical protein